MDRRDLLMLSMLLSRGRLDTPPVGTGTGIQAGFEETSCQSDLAKTGGRLGYARQTLVRVFTSVPREITRVCVKKAGLKYNNIYLI